MGWNPGHVVGLFRGASRRSLDFVNPEILSFVAVPEDPPRHKLEAVVRAVFTLQRDVFRDAAERRFERADDGL